MADIDPIAGEWYWIAGRGPCKFRLGTEYQTFEGLSYWSEPRWLTRKLKMVDLHKHSDALIRVFDVKRIPISFTSIKFLEGRVTLNPDVTTGEVVNSIMKIFRGAVLAEIEEMYNTIIPEVFPLTHYGITCPVKKLLSHMPTTNTVLPTHLLPIR